MGAFFVARDALDQLGFQPQIGPEPFPESRPMRVGATTYRGKAYRVHAHVIRNGDREAQNLIKFRDRLRADAALVQAYQAEKLSILSSGITASTEYSKAKSDFIRAVLGDSVGSSRTESMTCAPASQIFPPVKTAIEKRACSCL